MQRFWKLWCRIAGHRRGRRMTVADLTPAEYRAGLIAYRCARCGATWTRKMRKQVVSKPI